MAEDTAAPTRTADLDHHLDAGPLARFVGAQVRRLKLRQSIPIAVFGLLALAAFVVVPYWIAAAAGLVIAGVVISGLSWWRPVGGRLGWLLPALLRGIEYSLVVRFTAVVSPDAMPAAYAFLAAVAYHHYDTVYRLRHTGTGPSPWTYVIGLGYDGRLILVALFVAGGAQVLAYGLWALAVQLGLVFVIESVAGWVGWVRAQAEVDRAARESAA